MNTKPQFITSLPKFLSPPKELISRAIFSNQPTSLFEYCLQYICSTIQHYKTETRPSPDDPDNSQLSTTQFEKQVNLLEYLNAEILSELIKRVSDSMLSCEVMSSFPLESLLYLDLRVCC